MTKQELLDYIQLMVPELKHCKHLNIGVEKIAEGYLSLSLPYSESIIGNPETGVIHGGALTTLMDTACGFAAISALDSPSICPTLDLRIDYMKPADPGKMVIGEAEAYRVANNVIFARGLAYHPDEKDVPIAHCTASFMRLDPKTTASNSKA